MTIDVAFIPSTHTSYDVRRYEGYKKYRFICRNPYVKKGDIIESPDYTSKMIVTEVYPLDARSAHNGICLKVINIHKINSILEEEHIQARSISEISPARNTRVLAISIDQARTWYMSGEPQLRGLALQIFTKDELEFPISTSEIENLSSTTCMCVSIPQADLEKEKAICKLRLIANYLNKGWTKTAVNKGYFIAGKDSIFNHNSVCYPGVVYFKEEKLARHALKIAEKENWISDLCD